MNTLELKKLLRDQLSLELELIEFIEECIKEIFPNDNERKQAINQFKGNLENMDEYGCIQSLSCIRRNIAVGGKYIYREEEKS
jgi:hypothetical protein